VPGFQIAIVILGGALAAWGSFGLLTAEHRDRAQTYAGSDACAHRRTCRLGDPRARQTIYALVYVFVISLVVLVPDQADWALGAELLCAALLNLVVAIPR
jgi:hypothetical protein